MTKDDEENTLFPENGNGNGSRSTDEQDKTYENEHERDYSPMVQLSVREYDNLKEQQKFISDKTLIDIIDNIERLVRALRKHIVRTDIK